jgi:hypothetical protein
VISETVAHIQRDGLLDQQNLQDLLDDLIKPSGWRAPFLFGDALVLDVLLLDNDVLMRALRTVKQKQDRRFSLVDATNVVLMEKHQIDLIFTFDTYYDGVTVTRGHTVRFLQRVPE